MACLWWAIILAGPRADDDWFVDYPFTVTPEGVGGVLEIRVTNAAGRYWVSLYDPAGVERRSTEVSPAYGVYFTYPADQAGTWIVTAGYPFATGVSARVEFTLDPGGGNDGGDDHSCGLLGLEAFLFLAWRGCRRSRAA